MSLSAPGCTTAHWTGCGPKPSALPVPIPEGESVHRIVVDGALSFTPDPGFVGTDFFQIRAVDSTQQIVLGFAFVTVSPQTECPGDINGDGVVDGADLAVLLAGWGQCP